MNFRRVWREIFLFSLLSCVALGPRILDLGVFVTHDEAEFWLKRAEIFASALQRGDFAATAITTHPGVTTMWLGSAGIALRRYLFTFGLLPSDTFPITLALMRLPIALTNVAGLLLSYLLLRRIFAPSVALLAALLWATDPFLIGYSRLLHVDALTATFISLSLLAACNFWHHTSHPFLLILSGIAAGLALLSKSPAILILPLVAGIALFKTIRDYEIPLVESTALAVGSRLKPWIPREKSLGFSLFDSKFRGFIAGKERNKYLQRNLLPLLVWGSIVGLTVMLVWPAVWADFGGVVQLLRVGVEVEGAQPHMTGNFFLGQRNDAPGMLFYPVALALRTTPLTLLGLFLLPWAYRTFPFGTSEGEAKCKGQRDLATFAAFILLFIAAMSLFPKKFNRYLIPIFPCLDILAAVGLAWGANQWGKLKVKKVVLGSITLLALLNVVWWHPYSLVAFNQLLGGAPMGAKTFAVGWGEGLEQVANFLNAQPDIGEVLTISHMITSLNPYLQKGAQAAFPKEGKLRDKAGYLVVYLPQVQGGNPSSPFEQFYGQAIPLHVVKIHGVDYAWIYQVSPPVQHSQTANFSDTFRLHGFSRQNDLLTLFWEIRRSPPADYWFFVHTFSPAGKIVQQIDQPYPTKSWPPGRYLTTSFPLQLLADRPQVVIGWYASQTGQRLPLKADSLAPLLLDGPDALLLQGVFEEVPSLPPR